MRLTVWMLLLACVACAQTERGWRGSMAGDYRLVAACAADRLSLSQTLREDQRVAILASGARAPSAPYEARLQETAPDRFFAEIRSGGDRPAALATWQVIQGCAEGGPDRLHPPGFVRTALF